MRRTLLYKITIHYTHPWTQQTRMHIARRGLAFQEN